MRKKLLLEQNIQLFDRLTAAEGEIKRLKNEPKAIGIPIISEIPGQR